MVVDSAGLETTISTCLGLDVVVLRETLMTGRREKEGRNETMERVCLCRTAEPTVGDPVGMNPRLHVRFKDSVGQVPTRMLAPFRSVRIGAIPS
jgi:hypothetical protein